MRAYLRLDPRLPDSKGGYPDGALAAFVLTVCLAESQSPRGRFRNTAVLRALLGRRAKWVQHLVDHGDVTVQPDGWVYVDGWDEWQEGDWKVAERVSRIRSRHVTPTTVTSVTPTTVSNLQDGEAVSIRAVSGERAPATDDAFDAYWQITGAYPAPVAQQILEEVLALSCGNHQRVIGYLRTAWQERDEARTLAKRAKNLALRDAHEAERREAADEKRRLADKRKPVAPVGYRPPKDEPMDPAEAARRVAEYDAAAAAARAS